MAYTVTQLAALQAALASGELIVRIDDKEIKYRSIDDLQKAIAAVQDGLAGQGLAEARPRFALTYVNKG